MPPPNIVLLDVLIQSVIYDVIMISRKKLACGKGMTNIPFRTQLLPENIHIF